MLGPGHIVWAKALLEEVMEAAMPFDVSPEESQLIEAELARLRQEHRDLDAAIEALERLATVDQIQVQRLKKRKLHLKDRVGYLEDRLTPDIIA